VIPYGRQRISKSDITAVAKAMKSEFLTTGPKVGEFESNLSEYIGAETIAVSSGTAALHCAYSALDLKPGDEVITPPLTFIATQATASMFGAKIRFADVQPDTGNLDPSKVEAVISDKTRAIVAVDYAGHPAELSELAELAARNNILLIEDAAHSMGSIYKGTRIGGIADITTFSFFPTKNMTTGEGGAVSSNNPKLLNRIREFSRQGLIRDKSRFESVNEGPWHQEVQNFGLNYRLPDILCALGSSQLKQISEFKENRGRVYDQYFKHLEGIPNLNLPVQRDYVDPMWHLFPIRVNPLIRRYLFEVLRKNNIGVQVNYLPAHLHPVFTRQGYARGDYPISELYYDSEISLPMHANLNVLNKHFFKKISSIIRSVLREA
jgi:dTDP-4-amino-4,6-dideoxygalactose transaminase